jgi:hypothetical protein
MPSGRTKLTSAAVAVVGALLVAGCGGTENHTWQGEFTERLEGASAAVEVGGRNRNSPRTMTNCSAQVWNSLERSSSRTN